MGVQKDKATLLEFSIRLNKVLNMMGWPLRGRAPKLVQALAEHGITISEPGCNKWLAAKSMPDTPKLEAISKITGKSSDYFLYGTETEVSEPSADYVIESFIKTKNVPHISWETVKDMLINNDVDTRAACDEMIVSQTKTTDRAFAVDYIGDEMTGNGMKTIPEGVTLIFDRLDEIKLPCKVLAVVHDDLVFRELVRDGGIKYLKPWNSQYRTIKVDDDVKICAVMVEYFYIERSL